MRQPVRVDRVGGPPHPAQRIHTCFEQTGKTEQDELPPRIPPRPPRIDPHATRRLRLQALPQHLLRQLRVGGTRRLLHDLTDQEAMMASFPARNCSIASGFSAMTSSAIAPRAPVSDTCASPRRSTMASTGSPDSNAS